MYRTTAAKCRCTVTNSPHTSLIPVTQGESAFNVFDLKLKLIKETCCAARIISPLRTTSRATSSNFALGSANSVSALVTAVMCAYNRFTFTNFTN